MHFHPNGSQLKAQLKHQFQLGVELLHSVSHKSENCWLSLHIKGNLFRKDQGEKDLVIKNGAITVKKFPHKNFLWRTPVMMAGK